MNIRSFLVAIFFVLSNSFMSLASHIQNDAVYNLSRTFVSDESDDLIDSDFSDVFEDDEEIMHLQNLPKKSNQTLPLVVYDFGNEAQTYSQLIELRERSFQAFRPHNHYLPERQFNNSPPQNAVRPVVLNRGKDGKLSETSDQNFYH